MRVLLVAENREKKPTPAIPLGLCYVAEAVRRAGHSVKFVDLMFADGFERHIAEAIDGFEPEAIGISLRNLDDMDSVEPVFYPPMARRVVDFIKSLSGAPIIAGGYAVSIAPEEMLRYLGVEIGVVGEGEIAFPKVLEQVGKSRELAAIPGVALLEDGELTYRKPELIPDLNKLPAPALDLIDYPRYLAEGTEACVQTKRGCPFNCTYCPVPIFQGAALRLREPAAVVDEMEGLVRGFGAEKFYIGDNIFNFPLEHAVAISEEIIRRRLKMSWTSYFHPSFLNKESAHAFKMSGCSLVIFNTGAVLAEERSMDLKALEKASEICAGQELPFAHYLVFGEPGHSLMMLKEVCSIMEKVRPTGFYIIPAVRVYPGSRLARIAEERGCGLGSLFESKFYPHPERGEIGKYVKEICREHKRWYYSMKVPSG